MVADPEIVKDRLLRILNEIRLLKRFREISLEDFLQNEERQRAVLHCLQLCLEGSADIAFHICAGEKLGAPSTYSEAFDFLNKIKILSSEEATQMSKIAGLRNRIVHEYTKLDLTLVYQFTHQNLNDIETFVQRVQQYLSR